MAAFTSVIAGLMSIPAIVISMNALEISQQQQNDSKKQRMEDQKERARDRAAAQQEQARAKAEADIGRNGIVAGGIIWSDDEAGEPWEWQFRNGNSLPVTLHLRLRPGNDPKLAKSSHLFYEYNIEPLH